MGKLAIEGNSIIISESVFNALMAEEIDDIEPTKTGRVFTELAGDVRRTVLLKLNERSLKLSELAKELDTSIQHAHSNINRLIDTGLVKKTSNGSLSLTTFGFYVSVTFSTPAKC